MIEYRLTDNNKYEMINIDTGKVLDTMSEVALLYEWNPDDRNIKATLLKHGKYNRVIPYYQIYKQNFNNIFMLTDRFIVDDINKSLSTTGYIYNIVKGYHGE